MAICASCTMMFVRAQGIRSVDTHITIYPQICMQDTYDLSMEKYQPAKYSFWFCCVLFCRCLHRGAVDGITGLVSFTLVTGATVLTECAFRTELFCGDCMERGNRRQNIDEGWVIFYERYLYYYRWEILGVIICDMIKRMSRMSMMLFFSYWQQRCSNSIVLYCF